MEDICPYIVASSQTFLASRSAYELVLWLT
jgi:hypothetical protein